MSGVEKEQARESRFCIVFFVGNEKDEKEEYKDERDDVDDEDKDIEDDAMDGETDDEDEEEEASQIDESRRTISCRHKI